MALTGGVGAGKSALGDLLAARGAVRIDADVLAREVVAPGTGGLAAVVARFGRGVLDDGGRLDRAALASTVFHDPAALADLNAIVHPLVARRARQLLAAVPAGTIAVYEIPLLAETGRRADFDVVVVVEASMPVRLARLAARGLDPTQADARIAAQAGDAERRAIGDEVVVNDSTRVALETTAEALWGRLLARQGAGGGPV